MTQDYINLLGNHGEGANVSTVLDDTFQFPDNTTDATKDFINACRYHPEVENVQNDQDIKTRYKDVKRLWRIRKEKHAPMENISDIIKQL